MAPTIQESMLQAVVEVLNKAATQPAIRKYRDAYSLALEEALCDLSAQRECLLFSSATAGLEAVLRALGVGNEDEVVLSGYDYPGNFWAVERVGARPVLIDIESIGWRFNLQALDDVCGKEHAIKALVVSHLHGQLQDTARLREICTRAGISLIEDCCQSLGARDEEGRPIGSHSDALLFSFGGGKTITGGRGGALLTNDPRLAQRTRISSGAGSGPYALSEIQAAMIGAQLPWLDELNAHCQEGFENAHARLESAETTIQTSLPCLNHISRTGFYQCGWQTLSPRDPEHFEPEVTQSALIGDLINLGVPAGKGFDGFHRRSTRRCRVPMPLIETAKRVTETFVIHHRYLLEQPRDDVKLGTALVEVLSRPS